MLVLGHVLGMEMFRLLLLSDNILQNLVAKNTIGVLMDSGVRNLNTAEWLIFCWDLIWEDLKTGDDLEVGDWSFLESVSLVYILGSPLAYKSPTCGLSIWSLCVGWFGLPYNVSGVPRELK